MKFVNKIKKIIHGIRQNHSVFRVHRIRQLGMAEKYIKYFYLLKLKLFLNTLKFYFK